MEKCNLVKSNEMKLNSLKKKFKRFDINKVPEYNKPNFENDSIDVLNEKYKTIAKQFQSN